MAWADNKKASTGFNYSNGIISTDPDFSWFQEKFGLSPNQLSNDIWMKEIPAALNLSTAETNANNNDFIARHDGSNANNDQGYVKLVLESTQLSGDHLGTLYLARDNVNANSGAGNRMRNFINPNNHLDTAGNISIGYTVRLFESLANGSGPDTTKPISTGNRDWFFYYKEGALVFDENQTPTNSGNVYLLETGPNSAGHNVLWAQLFRYVGPTLTSVDNTGNTQFFNSTTPNSGQVLSYDANGNLAWVDNTAGPQGPQGPQGPEGPQGPAGNDGATGDSRPNWRNR